MHNLLVVQLSVLVNRKYKYQYLNLMVIYSEFSLEKKSHEVFGKTVGKKIGERNEKKVARTKTVVVVVDDDDAERKKTCRLL